MSSRLFVQAQRGHAVGVLDDLGVRALSVARYAKGLRSLRCFLEVQLRLDHVVRWVGQDGHAFTFEISGGLHACNIVIQLTPLQVVGQTRLCATQNMSLRSVGP